MTPGTRIKIRRQELGISQVKLARLAGMAQSSLSELERGDSHMPSAENLIGLSKALRISKSWILTGKDGEIEILDQEEERLMNDLRLLGVEERRAVYAIVRSMAAASDTDSK